MTMTATDTQPRTGLFPANYDISTGLLGAPTLTLNLLVSTPNEHITGFGHLTQPTNPPLDLWFTLDGDYTKLVSGPNEQTIVVLTGTPRTHWPPDAGHGPVVLPDLKVRMLLPNDWSSGTATYSYLDSQGQWVSITNVPAKLVNSGQPNPS